MPRVAETRGQQRSKKTHLASMKEFSCSAACFLHYRRCIQDLWSLCQLIFDIHRGRAHLEFKGMLDNQSPVTNPEWQVVLQCSQPWEHAVNHSPHLLIIRTQGAGSYPTMYCAKRKHSSLFTIHDWAHSAVLDMDVFGLLDRNLSTKWEVESSSQGGRSQGIGNILLCVCSVNHRVTMSFY